MLSAWIAEMQFAYNWENMRLGKPVDISSRSQDFTR
jgi:hypothetical protein